GGFGTSFDIFGFDLSVDFTYQLGGYVYDGTYASLMSLDQGFGIHEDMLNAWSPENAGSNIPRMTYNDSYMASTSDRFLTDASFLSLQNVTLGYTLPKSFTTKFGVEKLRLYVVGDNLWVWSKRKGLDPRQSATGDASSALYSSIRTISGGVSITF
ncbi:MAG: SusC/RagA family protein, partial [Bacteroidaceae bacterium]|nr:SusC/RagA family protein [Bacteroidaceae bacterium]